MTHTDREDARLESMREFDERRKAEKADHRHREELRRFALLPVESSLSAPDRDALALPGV